jgi:hypothetical protein
MAMAFEVKDLLINIASGEGASGGEIAGIFLYGCRSTPPPTLYLVGALECPGPTVIGPAYIRPGDLDGEEFGMLKAQLARLIAKIKPRRASRKAPRKAPKRGAQLKKRSTPTRRKR